MTTSIQAASTRQRYVEQRDVFLSVIVPVHNEAENIQAFLDALRAQCEASAKRYEIIVVDDGSKDDSAHLVGDYCAHHAGVKLLCFSRNFNKENAIAAGLAHVSGHVAIIIDADFQHPVATIPRFLEQWANGFDMVYALREDRKNEGLIKRVFTKVFYGLLNHLSDGHIPPNAGDFRLIDRTAVDTLNACKERTKFMKGLYAWVGYKTTSILYKMEARRAGVSSWRFRKLTALAITGFISFSDIPLRIWGLIGLVISLISFLSVLYIVTNTLFFGADVPGYASIMVTVIFFGGIQLLSIGILGEYIARIFHEVKQRPPYVIAHRIGFTDAE